MKKIIILSLLAVGITGCHTMNRAPYAGGMGEYGFTYDLDATPSPFKDTSYRPLTVYDLAAPIIITVTNVAPPKVIYETAPEIGATRYTGESPSSGATVIGGFQINEASGADRNTSGGAAGGQFASGGGVAPSGGNSVGAPSVFVDSGDSINNTNVLTNNIVTNNVPTNNFPTNSFPTNSFPTNNFPTNNFPTNAVPTNSIPFPTNQVPTNNANFGQTNQFGRQPTNQVAPRGSTNSTLNQNQTLPNSNPQQAQTINEPSGAPAPSQLNQGSQDNQQSLVPNRQTTVAPQLGNAAQPPSQGTSQQPAPAAPPVAAPANP